MRKVNTNRIIKPMGVEKNVIDSTDEAYIQNGLNFGGYVFDLSNEDLDALSQGKTISLNIEDEYVVFIKKEEKEEE